MLFYTKTDNNTFQKQPKNIIINGIAIYPKTKLVLYWR